MSKSSAAATEAALQEAGALQTRENNEQGLCRIDVQTLARLAAAASSTQGSNIGEQYFVTSVALDAVTEDESIQIKCTFDVVVLEAGWTVVPLLPETVALLEAEVQPGAGVDGETATDLNPTETAVLTSSSQHKHVLVTKNAGTYRVTATVLCPYASKLRKDMRLAFLPACSSTAFSLLVSKRSNVQVTVSPALQTLHSSEAGGMRVQCTLPPTSSLSATWTQKDMSLQAAEPAPSKPLSATVALNHLFTIGEGVLLTDTEFVYDIRNGTISVFDIAIDPRLRVLSVECEYVKTWDVVQSATSSGAFRRLLRVALQHGVDGRFVIEVTGEMQLEGTSCKFETPCFSHVHEAISREKGLIAMQANTSVEVDQEGDCVSITPIDVEELPSSVRGRASNPILLAYKYLRPDYSLSLSVKKHGDIDVLVAACDVASFTSTVTDETKVMTRIILSCRNTQKQYVRIGIPTDCEVWSTAVAGQAVKPARDTTTNELMIPLLKSSAAQGEQKQASFAVEVIYVRDSPRDTSGKPVPMTEGQLALHFPKVDLPLNKLFVSVNLPDGYDYEDAEGDLKAVDYFSGTLPSGDQAPDDAFGGAPGGGGANRNNLRRPPQAPMMISQVANVMHRSASISRLSISSEDSEELDLDEEEDLPSIRPASNMLSLGMSSAPSKTKQRKAGVVPVRVQMVQVGKELRFERLLVVETEMHLRIPYKKQPEKKGGCCGRRK